MTTSLRLALLLAFLVPQPAAAEDLYGEQRGINRVRKGVWEISAASLFAFANASQGDSSVFRLVTDVNGTVSYFIRDNVSVGVTGLLGYETTGDDNSAITYGGGLDATAHLRLGFGAFFRPGVVVGVLLGNREIPVGGTTVMEASQLGFTARLRLPIAYFISRNIHFEGGPQFNFTVGRYSPEGLDPVSFTTIDGGFSVGAGYSF